MTTKYLLTSSFFAMTLLVSPLAVAHASSPTRVCATIPYNLRIGATDTNTAGAVTTLQGFLAGEGYFDSSLIGTGRFGPATYRAVVRYQLAQSLPGTGYVGSMTRGAITGVSCGTPSTKPISIYSITPSAGPTETSVTLTGFGFTSDNTILMNGSVAARNVPITSSIAIACTTNPSCHGGINQSITFTIPSSLAPNCPAGSMCPMYMRLVTPGTYQISVENSSGSSNSVAFTVTDSSSNQPLTVQGLDAPTTLTIGQNGTWTVRLGAQTTTGNLHYSVTWGDEGTYNTSSIMAPQPSSISTSASFTHFYQRSGTYTPRFTVTDDSGHSVTASNSITVTPLY